MSVREFYMETVIELTSSLSLSPSHLVGSRLHSPSSPTPSPSPNTPLTEEDGGTCSRYVTTFRAPNPLGLRNKFRPLLELGC
jgi:hypothetical protein